MHALIHKPTRGLVMVRNEPSAAALLAQLQSAFDSFKSRNEGRISELQAGLEEMNSSIAALKIGGAGASDGDGFAPKSSRRRAVQNLGTFARSGRAEDLTSGFKVSASMSGSSGPDGGYLVPEELGAEIMVLQRNSSVMRRLARVVQTNSATFKQIVATSGVDSGWVGEKQSRPETDGNSFAALEYPAMEVYANPAVTQSLLDDSAYDLGAFITTEIGDAFTEKEGAAFISGDGIGKPRGFLSYDTSSVSDKAGTRPFGTLQYIASGQASTLATEDPGDQLIDVVYSLKAKYRQNATWLMNSTTAAVVRKFKDDQDNYLWVEGIQAGQPNRLLGYPVEIDEDMSDIGTNAYPIAFGDWNRGYLITDRVGVRIVRDALTNKPYVHFYATKRVGGGLLDSNAIKLLKCASS